MDHTMNVTGIGDNTPNVSRTTALRRHYLLLAQKLKSQKQPILLNTDDKGSAGEAHAERTDSAESAADRPGRKNIGPKTKLATASLAILVVALLAALAFQAIGTSQDKALRIVQANRLKTIGLAVRTSTDNQGWQSNAAAFLMSHGVTDANALIDPVSQKPFVIVGGDETQPQKAIAYSPWIEGKGGACLLGDGSVQSYSAEQYKAVIQPYLPTNMPIPNGK